jgi:sugar-specific transcriptional regulator TrmB
MDYKLKEIILNYFVNQNEDEIQTWISKYEGVTNGDEEIRDKFSVELDRTIRDTIDSVSSVDGEDTKKFLVELLEYIYDSIDTDELATYIDWD